MIAINIENLSKKYYTKTHRELTELFANIADRNKRKKNNSFWVLKDINLDIEHGDRIGVVGSNGSGKSTLLKIISRVTIPTEGKLTISGTFASLLEVGTGFHPELTGRENVFLNASILGMTRRETINNFQAIIDFAEIEQKFVDTPVKRYSTGMQTRLAFSIASNIDRDIIILDEVMAVGDTFFQAKAFEQMYKLTKKGKTIVLVNHDHNKIKDFCNRAILIDKGKIIADNNPHSVVKEYLKKE